jgi:hypothetical protein
MKKLLEDPAAFYTPKVRPSGYDIGKGFSKDNGGAIPPNLLQIPNTEPNGQYLDGCKTIGEKQHPARFPAKLPEFFINMLTEPGDLVLDIFAGSNTTRQTAETRGGDGSRLNFLANMLEHQRSDFCTNRTPFQPRPQNHAASRLRHQHEPPMAGRKGIWMAQADRSDPPGEAARTAQGRLAVRPQLRSPQPHAAA